MQEELGGELVMIDQIEVSKVQNPTTDEKKKQTITVIAVSYTHLLLTRTCLIGCSSVLSRTGSPMVGLQKRM